MLRGGAALAVAGGLAPAARTASAGESGKVRVAAVFLAQVRNSWPYPGFDAAGRQREILAALSQGCPEVEFVPVTIATPADTGKALDLRDQVDGYLVYVATLSWALGGTLAAIGKLKKPTGGGRRIPGRFRGVSHRRPGVGPRRRGGGRVDDSAGRPRGGRPAVRCAAYPRPHARRVRPAV